MTDKQPTQAATDGKTAPDPVEQTPGEGESGGGAYPNPHTGEKGEGTGGFMGHGGQSEIAYSGTGQGGGDDDPEVGNVNAPASG